MTDRGEERQTEFERLLQQLNAGSDEAAARIIELYSDAILQAVRRSLPRVIRSKMDSIDIFQSVWLSILAEPSRLVDLSTPQRFVRYVAGTARLKALEKYRHFTRRQGFDVRREQGMTEPVRVVGDPESTGITEVAIADCRYPPATAVAEAREAWQKLMSRCDERDQTLVRLRLAGQSNEEIAQRLNVTPRTVQRSLKRLLNAVAS